MSIQAFYALLSVLGVSLLSLLGIVFFLFEESIVRRSLLFFVSFSTGALLGDVFIHIIPDLAARPETFPRDLTIVLVGILFSFVLEKIIHWRHCHDLSCAEHHPAGLINLIGESMHNFIDGIVIAASFLASIPLGLSTSLAILFHEIPHEVGNVAILLHSGYPKMKAVIFNCLSALSALAGAILVLVSASFSSSISDLLLPFAAGNLLYIAGSDLIPELHRETKPLHSIGQLLCIMAGMGVMYGILLLE